MKSKCFFDQSIREKLRGTLLHRVYAFLRYEFPIIIVFRVHQNVRKGKVQKILRFVVNEIRGLFTETPKAVAIDIVACCNLRCPLCSVPPFLTKKQGNFMTFDDFVRIVDGIKHTTDLSLVYAGEPFLHPKFFDMVTFCTNSYYTTTITNGTLLDAKNIRRLLESGLDFLQISFDGFSKESYEKYRIGANFESVKKQIEELLATRQIENAGLPHITITYLVNAFNEHEKGECRRYFIGLGVDRFYEKAINLNVHRRSDGKSEQELREWLPSKEQISLYEEHGGRIAFKEKRGVCTTCLSPIIRNDGEVLVCCHDIFNTVKIGNALRESFDTLWAGKEYTRIRRLAKQRRLPICQKCGK